MAESARELIAVDIVETLKEINNPRPVFVTREPIELDDLSMQQLPCLLVRSTEEERSDITMTGSTILREGVLTLEITGYLRGGPDLDHRINTMIELVEEELDKDRTRDGNARNTAVVSVSINTDIEPPLAAFTITVQVYYTYRRGTI